MSKIVLIKYLIAVSTFSVLCACSSSRKTVSRNENPPATSVLTPVKKTEEKNKETIHAPHNEPLTTKEVKKATYNIAFFTPLYLDSAFATSNELSGRIMPKYVLPGLEFYEGAQLALDTLQQLGYNLNVTIYDSKGKQSIASLIRDKSLDHVDLIIGAVNNPELKALSDFTKNKKINFVSATFPNDGGINDNPFLYITNSTLRTHCDALHNYVQQNFMNKNIVLFHRNTALESRLADDFKSLYDKMESSKKTKIKEVVWRDGTTPEEISKYLLTDRNNLIIITALDEAGAKTLLRKLSTVAATYPLQIFGMPTWDVFKLKEPEFQGLQIYYSSPYFNDKTDAYSKYINDYFRRTYKARPSDMVFKSFDLTYYFITLLHNNGVYFSDMLDKSPRIITNYNFQPVYMKEGTHTPSYFENKNVFIIQKNIEEGADVKMNK